MLPMFVVRANDIVVWFTPGTPACTLVLLPSPLRLRSAYWSVGTGLSGSLSALTKANQSLSFFSNQKSLLGLNL